MESHKFTSEEQLQIVRWIAVFKTRKEIIDLVKREFGKSIHYDTIRFYEWADNWQTTIQKERAKYSQELYKVELANERRRIEELEDNYWTLKARGHLKDANAALHEIHEQLEKPRDFIQNNYQLNIYKEMSDEDFDRRELELIQKRKQIKEELDAREI